MHYNFCQIHKTLRMTPAMAAGISDHLWELEDIVNLLNENETDPLPKSPIRLSVQNITEPLL